jgi:hypothetical protein
MSAESPQPQQPNAPSVPWFQWLVLGIAGVAFVFVASVHLPDALKIPGFLTVGLGAAAGWGWGRLGQSQGITPSRWIAVVVWSTLAAAELLAAWKSHTDQAEFLRNKWRPIMNNPVVVGYRESLVQEPENESPDEREARLQQLAELDEGDSKRLKRLEFRGYLASRFERFKSHALTTDPWPLLIWLIEVLAGSTIGAWLALSALRTAPRQSP